MAQENEHNEALEYCNSINDELIEAYENGTLEKGIYEQLDVTSYYTRAGGEYEYSHSEILITCNGPDVRLYTDTGILRYCCDFTSEDFYIFSEIVDEINDLLNY